MINNDNNDRIRTPSSEAYNVLRGSEDIYSSISLDNGAYAKQYGSQAVAGRSIVHEQVLQVRRHEDPTLLTITTVWRYPPFASVSVAMHLKLFEAITGLCCP